MLVRTKTRRIKRNTPVKRKARASVKERPVPWREVLKEHLEKYTEAGVLLRANRNKLEMTQKELSDVLGIAQNHISEMENGKRSIGKEIAKRFAEFFKTDYRLFL